MKRTLHIIGTKKIAGELDGYGKFRKTVKKSKHFCWKHQAWGIEAYLWDEDIADHTDEIEIIDSENRIKYKAKTNEIKDKVLYDDLGWGSQVFLKNDLFNKEHY